MIIADRPQTVFPPADAPEPAVYPPSQLRPRPPRRAAPKHVRPRRTHRRRPVRPARVLAPRRPRRPGRSALALEATLVCLVVGLLALCYLSLRWYGFDLLEEGYFLTNARAVQLGHLPYRDFDTPYTPGVFYLYASLLDRFGPHITALRSLQVVGRVIFFVALYACGRQVTSPFFAAIAPVSVALMDTAPETWGIHPGWFSAPASVLAAFAIVRYTGNGRARWLFLSGIFSGIGFAFKQNLPAYGLVAALWFVAVAARHLPPLPLPQWLGGRWIASTLGRLPRRLMGTLRLAVQAMALLLFPLVATVIVRPYLSPLVFILFVLPLVALSLVAGWFFLIPPPHGRDDDTSGATTLAFLLRPVLLLAGFALVTLPWLVLTLHALDWNVRLLGVLVGQVDPTGYFYGMEPPTLDHLKVLAWTLLAPVTLGGLAAWGLWSRRGVALVVGLLTLLVASLITSAQAGQEPWNVVRGLYVLVRAGVTWWRTYGDRVEPATDTILYLPALAFWAALAYVSFRFNVQGSKWRGAGAPLNLEPGTLNLFWYLAAGAALFLNQYPRMDEIHWLWSSGLLLLCGAVVLHAWYRHALHLAPALARSSLGRAAFGGSLLLLPAFGVFPHVWARLNYWPALVPASPDDVHAATVGARSNPTPLTMPDGHADVWIPGEDHAAIAEVVQLLDEKTTPGEPIFTYPAIPGFYFLADRPNPTRFNHLFNGMASPRDQQQIVQQLEQVRYVVWDDGGAHYWVKPGDNAPVTEYIRTHYRVERFIGPYAVLSRDAAGPPLTYFAPAKPAAQSSL